MSFAAYLRPRRLTRCLALAALGAAWQYAGAQNGLDNPDATIPLAPLGYHAAPAHILLTEGYAVSSLHYVDNHHLLFTFNSRTLIQRMPDDSPDVNPQNVTAVLLELPSGKVVARADWRLHDHSQYLWSIGEGTLLLRLGRELRLITPFKDGVLDDEGLRGKKLMTLPGQATLITTSPDGRMVLVEADVAEQHAVTLPVSNPANVSPIGTPLGNVQPPPEDHTTELQFLEFDLSQQAHAIINVKVLARMTAPSPLSIPLVRDGYVHAQEIYPDDWGLIYTHLGGASVPLGDVVSTCRPGVIFLSNKEMLVQTCDGSETSLSLTLVTLDKKELWQRSLDSTGQQPSIRSTAASGRFAVSHLLTESISSGSGLQLTQEDIHKQRIDVMDVESGALVASVNTAPAERSGQNFALSADGRHLAVLQKDDIALYDLAAPQEFPAKKVKPKEMIFVAAADGAPLPGPYVAPSTAKAVPVVVPTAAPVKQTVIEAPLNVDARKTPPSLLTPAEKQSVESKKNKEITLAPPVIPQKDQPKEQ